MINFNDPKMDEAYTSSTESFNKALKLRNIPWVVCWAKPEFQFLRHRFRAKLIIKVGDAERHLDLVEFSSHAEITAFVAGLLYGTVTERKEIP